MPKKQELAVSAELQQELALAADEEAALERPALSTISLRSGVMTYMDNQIPDNTMDVIVVGVAFERTLYTTAFDADNITPPDCYALSLTGKDMGPDQDYGFGTLCSECPNDEWGSGRGRGKACGERRRLVVLPADAIDKGLDGAEMAMLKVPVTSIKNWGTYVNKLRTGAARPYWSVVTTVKVTPDAKTQFKVNFDLKEVVNDPTLLAALRNANGESEVYTMQPFDMAGEVEEPASSDKF